MGRWRSDFVLDLGPRRVEVDELAAITPEWWGRFAPGLVVRVKGDRVKVWHNEWSQCSTRPVFRGRLVNDAAGARIAGTLSWGLLYLWYATYVWMTFVCVVVGVASLRSGDGGWGLAALLLGAAFAGFGIQERLSSARKRACYEEELRESVPDRLGTERSLS